MNYWLIFAILGPMLWGFSNVIDSGVRRQFVKNDFAMTWFLSATRLPLVAALFIFMGAKAPGYTEVLWMIIGGLMWIVPYVFYYKAVEREEISRIALFSQIVPVFTLIIAFFALKERLSMPQFAAFVLLLAGGALAAMKRLEGIWRFSKAFWLIALASFLWAGSDVIFKKFEPAFNGFLYAFSFYFLGSFIVSIITLFLKSGRTLITKYFSGLPPRAWVLLAIDQIFGISGSAAFAYALTLGKASLTTVIIGTQPIFVLIFNLILSKCVKEIQKEDTNRKVLFIKGISFILIILGLVYL